MKKYLFLLAVTALTLPLSAQSKFGIKIGTILQSESSSNLMFLERNNIGFTGGIYWYSELAFLPVYIQPELMYNAFGYRYQNRYPSGLSFSSCGFCDYKHATNTSLSLPVLLGIRIAFLRVNAGPDFRLATFRRDDNYALHMSKYGFIAGGGLTIGAVDIDLRYRVNLDDSAIHYNYDDFKSAISFLYNDFKENHSFKDKGFTTITIGFKFGNGK